MKISKMLKLEQRFPFVQHSDTSNLVSLTLTTLIYNGYIDCKCWYITGVEIHLNLLNDFHVLESGE